jgi:hypothetical protein
MDTEKAMRYNTGKLKWHLVHQPSLEPMVRVLEYGANKYAPGNWKKGQSINELYDCLTRHMNAFMDGEDNDPESGESHIGHVLCNAMFIVYNLNHRPENDDRDKPVPALGKSDLCCGRWDENGICTCRKTGQAPDKQPDKLGWVIVPKTYTVNCTSKDCACQSCNAPVPINN